MNMNKSILLSSFIMFIFTTTTVISAEISTEKQKLSYAMGIYFSQSIVNQNIDMDVDAFIQAITDSLNKSELKLSQAEIQNALTAYQQQLAAKRNASAEGNKASGLKFLEDNKQKDGVVVLDSGLQYKVINQGDGVKPDKNSTVKVHYHGTLIDGKVFDSSYDRGQPITLSLNQVIKGWQEALPLMNVGSKWKIYVPAELAYGKRGAGSSIGANETLIFDIELLAVN